VNLSTFKILHKKFSSKKLNSEIWNSKEYVDYFNAIHDNEEIADWYLKQQIKKSKVKVGKHCCTKMTYYLTFNKKGNQINYDSVVVFSRKGKSYGIPIHDGGSSFIEINWCPWCGSHLTN
jgi:phage gp36-like protein